MSSPQPGPEASARGKSPERRHPDAHPALSRWPLVGRRDELELVMGALADAELAGVVLSGEAGVGKSRVAAEALARARSDGRACAWAAATRAASSIPFGALAHLLPAPQSAAISRLDYLRRAAASIANRPTGGSGPLVLAIDDAHLLDEGSAALVHQLAITRAARLLLTVRDSDPPAPDAITALWAGGLTKRVRLGPLSKAELEELAPLALEGELAGTATFALWKATHGNPLLLRELILDALESGALSSAGGVWQLTGRLTTGVRTIELIEQRLGRLSARERNALELLAIGEPLPLSLLESLSSAAIVAQLDERGLLRVLTREQEAYLRLAHPLHAEALRAQISALRARNAKRKLADGLDAATAPTELMRIAVWRLESGAPPDPALYMRAAERAMTMFEPLIAKQLSGAAADGKNDFGARHLHALAMVFCGEVTAAIEQFERLLDRAEDDLQRALAADGLASTLFWVAGEGDRAMSVAHAAREAVSDPDSRDRLTALSAMFAGFQGRPAQAATIVEPLLRRRSPADQIGARAALAAAIAAATAGVAAAVGAIVQRWLPAVEGLTVSVPLAPDQFQATHALALMLSGHLDEARDLANSCYEGAVANSADEAVGMWALCIGRIALIRGELDEAGRRLRESAALLDTIDSVGWLPWTLACLGHLASIRGDDATAARELERSAELARPTLQIYLADVELAHAWALAARGERSAARMRALAVAERTAKTGQLGFAVLAAHQLTRLGDPAAAVRRLQPLIRRVDGPLAPACLRYARALRARDGAELEGSAEQFARLGAGVFAAEAAVEAVAAHRQAGDELRAQAARRREQAFRARSPEMRTPSLQMTASDDVLTRREREVARLAAGGLSTRAIAERLTLSPRTVDNHLQRVYRKLAIAGREDLAAAFGSEGDGEG